MIDAEHTWYQPALDAYTLLLSQELNRPPPKALLGKEGINWNGPVI
jgi:proline dehydrogenase